MLTRLTLFGLLAALASSTGCSTWSKSTSTSKDSPWSISKLWKKEYQQPQSMAVIWAPDVLTVPGKPPTRGFGGRVYFYNELSQAIPIDGELMVHGYAKQDRKNRSEEIAADKTFGFTAEQLAGHFSPSDMGASYSIWIPWDAAEGLRQEITLIPTFKSKDGSIVQGSSAKVNLPGRTEDGKPESVMQTVSYTQSSTPTNMGQEPEAPVETMRTTTINVPSNASLVKPRKFESYTLNTQPPSSGQSTQQSATLYGASTNVNAATGVTLGGAALAPTQTIHQPTGQGSSLPALPGPGFSPGLPASSLIIPGLNDMPELSPSRTGVRPLEFKSLSPPPMASAIPKATPMPKSNLPDWTGRTQPVQRASFNSTK